MTNGIDTVQQKSADELNIFYTNPHLIYSECYRDNNTNFGQSYVRTMGTGFYWTSDTYPFLDNNTKQVAHYESRQMDVNTSTVTFPQGQGLGLRAKGLAVRCIKN